MAAHSTLPAPPLRRIVLALALALSAAAPWSCALLRGPSRLPDPIRAGIAPIYPPLAFTKDGRLQGVEVDLAAALAPALGRRIEFVELPWEGLIRALVDGRIDVIMSGMSVTPDRAARVRFTDPYLEVGQMAVVRRDDYLRLHETDAMNAPGMRIGFLRGTTSEDFARGTLSRATPVPFDSVDDALAGLRGGRIDYFVMDAPGIWRIMGGLTPANPDLKGLYTPLTREYLAWAVRPDAHVLRERLNRVLAAWKADGTLENILDRWITVRKRTIEVRPRT